MLYGFLFGISVTLFAVSANMTSWTVPIEQIQHCTEGGGRITLHDNGSKKTIGCSSGMRGTFGQ